MREIFESLGQTFVADAIRDDQQQLVFDSIQNPQRYILDTRQQLFVTGFRQLNSANMHRLTLSANLSFAFGNFAQGVGLAHFNAKFRSESYNRYAFVIEKSK